MMLSADVLGAAGGEKIECPSQHHFPCLNTCLNTSFLVSTPADQHLFPRLNTWLLNAESCLNVEPQALVQKIKGWSCFEGAFRSNTTSRRLVEMSSDEAARCFDVT